MELSKNLSVLSTSIRSQIRNLVSITLYPPYVPICFQNLTIKNGFYHDQFFQVLIFFGSTKIILGYCITQQSRHNDQNVNKN